MLLLIMLIYLNKINLYYVLYKSQTPLAKLFGQKRTDKPEMEPCSVNISTKFPFYKSGEKPKVFCQNHASQVSYILIVIL